ncbi:MAG TPA: NAD(P)H-binding protein [Anaeromyxobacteraceae bacterium]|nr:NAD(P)H-binding protein [Anaeromyxobacteraceae bacterium]
MTKGTTLVLGGTGKTGRRVAERLAARGVPVRIGSRAGAPPFDWENPATWPAAIAGVERVYVSYQPDLAAPGAAEAIGAFTDLAVRQGARRLVLLSGRGEPEALRCEALVRDSGAEWTIVRSSWFAQNFSESFFLEPILAGEVALPVGDVREPFVDADDVADVAAAALLEDGHAGEVYEVTGPRLLTFAEAIETIAQATGRRVRFTSIPLEAYTSALADAGLPPGLVSLVGYLFREVLDGRNASVTDGVSRALGRAPRDFGEYARRVAATGVWSVASAAPEEAEGAAETI